MASGTNDKPVVNGEQSSQKPIELAIALPHSPATRINIHLTILATTIMLFMTTSDLGSSQGGTAMGSLVYAMPDVSRASTPCTFLR